MTFTPEEIQPVKDLIEDLAWEYGGVHSHFCAASFGTDVRHVSESGCLPPRALHPIRHRVPVILPLEAFDFWLDCANVRGDRRAADGAARRFLRSLRNFDRGQSRGQR